MTDYLNLPLGDESPETVTAVVEIPQGSINKYEYDKKLKVFRLDRNLHSPVHYPGDYGFLPRILAEDGDPLDTLILGGAPTLPGCVYDARPIGLFEILDQGIRDEKILAYAVGNPRFSNIHDHTQVQPHVLREVEHFFQFIKTSKARERKCSAGKAKTRRNG